MLSEACIVEMELEAIGHEYGLPPNLVIQASLGICAIYLAIVYSW